MLKPLNGRVVIRPDEKEKETDFGLVIPDTVMVEKPIKGTVVVGNDEVKEGDYVVFSKFGMDEVEYEKENLVVVSGSSILAIL